ncbi:flagellar biosynthetic protein FliR [Halothermothrix orenii]|uniref:Flagellar biosynthetic protein FliR n=1 Tax=Halothermothrix orenii (strain H 168 / OCM 544 / DSM 9562) TaxID=373903 RepID=B8CYQ1_HALOH|nr:flagellar biosynthetic protein FliR [Halothermothrix orenii]ACL70420.1 flagellar biosynthetic protein FliR [Halothermothrix orenii H 168]
MTLEDMLVNQTYQFLLIMFRYLGLFLIAPVFGSRVYPVRVKVSLALMLTFITLPLIGGQTVELPQQTVGILLDVIRESLIGFIIGYIFYLVFASIQLAGQFIDVRMGFAIANVMDPISGVTAPVVGQFKNIMAILVFLAINGHHLLLEGLYRSFQIIPLRGLTLGSEVFNLLFRTTGNMFIIAFKIALPVMGTLFIADVVFGFLARTVPQMNIFIIGLPMKILIGFIMLILSLGVAVYFFQDLFSEFYRELIKIIKLMG